MKRKKKLSEIVETYLKYRGKPRTDPIPAIHKAIIMAAYFDPIGSTKIMAMVLRGTNTGGFTGESFDEAIKREGWA